MQNIMGKSYQVIDETSWPRAMHCAVFRNSIEPAFCVTFDLDVTNFLKFVREQDYSFTLAMTYAACHAANEIEALRYRFLDGQIVLYDRIDTAFTYLNPETELFKVVSVPMCESIGEYAALARKTADEQEAYFTGPLGNDVFLGRGVDPHVTQKPFQQALPIHGTLLREISRSSRGIISDSRRFW